MRHLLSESGHRHIPAVGASHDANPVGSCDACLDDVADAGLDVLDPVEAQLAVVEIHEALSES